MPERLSSADFLNHVLDPDSFTSWDEPIDINDWDDDYQASLRVAAEKTGSDEAVVTGSGTIGHRPVAIVANEFGFLGGSIGRAAARRLIAAIRRATDEGLSLIAATGSGGTRMQEGTAAFVHMADIAAALSDHRDAHLPYLVHLGHPTTGGVFATWGSLGHITIGGPGALTGFLGPKVFEVLHGEPFPSGVQQTENLVRHGVIDAAIEFGDVPRYFEQVLSIVMDGPDRPHLERRSTEAQTRLSTWESVELTRDSRRITTRDVLRVAGRGTVELSGTTQGEPTAPMLIALTRIDGQPCVVVGHDRVAHTSVPLGPSALRGVQRAAQLAVELRLPLVTLVDTPGADLSAAAEEGALAGEIARSLATLSTLSVPSVSVLLSQGTGGGALALLPAAAKLAAQNAWLSPLPPEGASAIVYGDADHAAELAAKQGISATEMHAAGILDVLVPELPSDIDDPDPLAEAVGAEIGFQLRRLIATHRWPEVG